MEKHKIYAFLEEIRTRLVQNISPLDVNEAYEMVDAVIKEHDFYHQTPYFLSEWVFLKDQVLRNDSESLGYFDRFLDNIMYESATGVYEAFVNQKAEL